MKNIILLLLILISQINFAQSDNTETILYNASLKYDLMEGGYAFVNGMCEIRLNNKRGFINEEGKVVVPPKYDYSRDFSEGLALVSNDGEGVKFIDKNGNIVINLEPYYFVSYSPDFSEGLLPVSDGAWKPGNGKEEKIGYIDITGKLVIPTKYETAYGFENGFACVEIDDKFGIINKKGKEITSIIYDNYISFSNDGFATVSLNNKLGLIDKNGNIIIPTIYDEIGKTADGMIRVESNGKWGYFDINGKQVIPFKYEQARNFLEGSACVKIDDKSWVRIDKTGTIIKELPYSRVDFFNKKGVARFVILAERKIGLIDKNGIEIFSALNSLIHNKDYDLWEVKYKLNGRLVRYLLDNKGKRITKEYDDIGKFTKMGYALVSSNGKTGMIDNTGREIIPTEYYSLGEFSLTGLSITENAISRDYTKNTGIGLVAACREPYECGYLNKKNEIIIPFKYAFTGKFYNGIANVRELNTGKGEGLSYDHFINTKGECVLNCID